MLLSIFICFVSPFIKQQPAPDPSPTSTLQIASMWLIALHQNHLTHIDGPRSHFYPCSSSYMKQAILKHGFFHGSLLGLDRLIRENSDPWIYPKIKLDDQAMKYDPVP